MIPCVWYVADFKNPWEGAVVANLAAGLRRNGVAVEIYASGGGANVPVDGVRSWDALPLYERVTHVLFKGRLWHLWGRAPSWWNLVRLRARTVHTSLDAVPVWKGHPTRLLKEQLGRGESLLPPTFEVKVAWAGDTEAEEQKNSPAILVASPVGDALNQAAAELHMPLVALPCDDAGLLPVFSEMKKGRVLVVDGRPRNALLAAYFSMQGLPVVAREACLSSLLGKEGLILADGDGAPDWRRAIERALSDEGRTAAAAARRFLKTHFTAAESSGALADLYRSVMEGKMKAKA